MRPADVSPGRWLRLLPIIAIITVLIAVGASLVIIANALDSPIGELQPLMTFMLGSGAFTVGAAYLLYQSRLSQWLNSLRWTLMAAILLTVVMLFANVWLIAQLMFINTRDLNVMSGLLMFAAIVAIVAMSMIANTLIGRIHALTHATRRFAGGDFSTRIEPVGNDELAQLARTFNAMAEQIETMEDQKQKLEKARRDLIAWISHDLRTPLASMRAMNEALLDGVVNDPATTMRYLENSQREIQHLTYLIDDLFELTQLYSGRPNLALETVAIHELIHDAVNRVSVRAEGKDVTLIHDAEIQARLARIAPDKIQRVLLNLLDNALHHTPPGGTITVRAQCSAESLQVSVHNTGSYIAEADRQKVFSSFYRGESSRVRSKDGQRGTGLGLAIARGFVEAHAGHIWVESSPQGGTRFTFALPVDT